MEDAPPFVYPGDFCVDLDGFFSIGSMAGTPVRHREF